MYITYYYKCNWTIRKVHICACGDVIKIRAQGQKESRFRYLSNQVRSVYCTYRIVFCICAWGEVIRIQPLPVFCQTSQSVQGLAKHPRFPHPYMKQSFINISYLIYYLVIAIYFRTWKSSLHLLAIYLTRSDQGPSIFPHMKELPCCAGRWWLTIIYWPVMIEYFPQLADGSV